MTMKIHQVSIHQMTVQHQIQYSKTGVPLMYLAQVEYSRILKVSGHQTLTILGWIQWKNHLHDDHLLHLHLHLLLHPLHLLLSLLFEMMMNHFPLLGIAAAAAVAVRIPSSVLESSSVSM